MMRTFNSEGISFPFASGRPHYKLTERENEKRNEKYISYYRFTR